MAAKMAAKIAAKMADMFLAFHQNSQNWELN